MTDVELARRTGLTRQSIRRAMTGDQNFSVTTLLAIAEANGQEILIVPREAARALTTSTPTDAQHIPPVTNAVRNI